jgi:hypothetical protein
MPLPVEALVAVGRALSNHNCSELLRLRMNSTPVLLVCVLLSKRADSRAQSMDYLEQSRIRSISGYHLAMELGRAAALAQHLQQLST